MGENGENFVDNEDMDINNNDDPDITTLQQQTSFENDGLNVNNSNDNLSGNNMPNDNPNPNPNPNINVNNPGSNNAGNNNSNNNNNNNNSGNNSNNNNGNNQNPNANVKKEKPWHDCVYFSKSLREYIIKKWFNELNLKKCDTNDNENDILSDKVITNVIKYSECRYIRLECKYINIKQLKGIDYKMSDKKFQTQMKRNYSLHVYECCNYLALLKLVPIKHFKRNYHHFYLNPYFKKSHIQIINKNIKFNFDYIKKYYIKNNKLSPDAITVNQSNFKDKICFNDIDSSKIIVAIDDY